jgi:hypothetical protein
VKRRRNGSFQRSKPTVTWLIFTDGQEDMMGILELYFPSDEPTSAIEIRRGLDATVQKAMMAPPDWDVSPPGS